MFNYKPSPTVARFQADTTSFVKLIMGPVGGGKSSGALMEVLRRCIMQKPFQATPDGPRVRHTKCIILRNTMAQLLSTVKPLIDQWLVTMPPKPLGEWRLTDKTFEMRFKLTDGTIVHADLIMMPADTPDDVRRLLSVECSFAWVEECREVAQEVFDGLQGRCDRYPSRGMGGVTYAGCIGSTNPPPIGGFWHKVLNNPPEGWSVFFQPPALLDDYQLNTGQMESKGIPKAENLDNLSPTYYEKLISGKTDDWIRVYLMNKFGAGGAGKPVFRNSFKKEFHVAKETLLPLMTSIAPFVVGWDNGLTGAAVIGQLTPLGRVNVLGCCQVGEGESMGQESFMDKIFIPYILARFPGVPRSSFMIVTDPACWDRSQLNEKTIAMALMQRGFRVVKAVTNDPERRISAVEILLSRAIDGGPGMLFSPEAKHIADALEWGFKYKQTKAEDAPLVFDKTWHSHIADACQYLALHFAGEVDPVIAAQKPKARQIQRHAHMY